MKLGIPPLHDVGKFILEVPFPSPIRYPTSALNPTKDAHDGSPSQTQELGGRLDGR